MPAPTMPACLFENAFMASPPCEIKGENTPCRWVDAIPALQDQEGIDFDPKMTRRHFLKAAAALPALMTVPAPPVSAAGEPVSATCGRMPDGLGLREVAERKLHHHPGGFTNPFCTESYRRPFRLLRWKLFSENRHKHLYANETVRPVTIDWSKIDGRDDVSITFINHASLYIRDRERSVLVDPLFFGLMPFIKDFTPLHFARGEMPAADHVLITHGHYDHLDKPSLAALPSRTHVISPLGYARLFKALHMPNHQQLDWFQTARLGNWRITCLPAHHWTMRNPLVGPNTNLWAGYLIRTASGRTFYLSGDTAYWDGFADIGREADIDLAVINLGAYEPRWFMAQGHLNPAEAVTAFRQLKARQLAPVHWGTFRLGDEPVYLPPLELREEMARAGLAHRLLDLSHGQTYGLDGKPDLPPALL
jgi:N-acyl-phosphatidylethanolamine-hydrolysing phospholipase D